jgi:hypothetical protein
MHESKYSSGLVKHLQEHLGGSVVFKHSDQLTCGIPDISVNWRTKTTWLEIKREGGKIRGLQDRNMKRLAAVTGNAFYVVYSDTDVKIVHPVSEEVAFYGAGHKNHAIVGEFIRARA